MIYKTISLFLTAVYIIAAQDISLSKDTYLVGTDDTVTIINFGSEPVTLDSAIIEFESLDTTRYLGEPPYLRITEIFGETQLKTISWDLDSLGDNVYRCIIDTSSDTSRKSLTIGASGDSIRLTFVMVGTCRICAAIYYLSFSQAVLRLFYSNWQTAELKLEDGNVQVLVRRSSTAIRRSSVNEHESGIFLINGRHVSQQVVKMNRQRIRNMLFTKEHRLKWK